MRCRCGRESGLKENKSNCNFAVKRGLENLETNCFKVCFATSTFLGSLFEMSAKALEVSVSAVVEAEEVDDGNQVENLIILNIFALYGCIVKHNRLMFAFQTFHLRDAIFCIVKIQLRIVLSKLRLL